MSKGINFLAMDMLLLTLGLALKITYTGWPKKVSHYRESSLNRINNRQPG